MTNIQRFSATRPRSKVFRPPGFALIVTLLLMILLTVIAVGLLTLSTISMRSTGQGEAMAIARSNARLALMLAIGDIQKELGPDAKISATSQILDKANSSSGTVMKHPHLTGVWKSRQEALGATPDYDQVKAFQRWLVSSSRPDNLLLSDFPQAGVFDDPVLMVGSRGTGAGSEATYAGKIAVATSNPGMQGDLAWWVADENSKGFTNPVDSLLQGASPTVPDLLASAGTPGAYGMQAVDANFPANTQDSAKAVTNDQLALVSSAGTRTRDWFHDLSPYSQGLLTNVVKGGFRQDLNLYLELPRTAENWPFGSAAPAPGPNGKYALSEVNDYDVLGWKYLHNYYHLKERIQMLNGRPTMKVWTGITGAAPDDLTNPRWNAGVIRPTPVLVRALVFIGFGAVPAPSDATKRVVRLYAYPVVTLWNPYNVDLKLEPNQLNYLFTSLPMGHKIYVNDQLRDTYFWHGTASRTNSDGTTDYSGAAIQPMFYKGTTLAAGEAKMYSSVSTIKGSVGIHQLHGMEEVPFRYSSAFPGGLWGGGMAGGQVDDQQIVNAIGTSADEQIKIETFVTKWDSNEGAFRRDYPATFDIRGEHCTGNDGDYQKFMWGQKIGWLHESSTPPIASPDKVTKTNKPTARFSQVFNAPKPFMVVDVQLKALDEQDLPNKIWRDCIPSHPYQGVTQLGSDVTPYLAGAYKVRFDTINSYEEASSYLQYPLDISDKIHTCFGGSYFPDEGKSFITDREIAMAPFTSLAQLQHVPQQSSDNLYSSGHHFQNRAIGNSFASPGVPADKVKTAGSGWPFCLDMYMNSAGGTINGTKFPNNQFHSRPNIDRSYAANHLLWDDYFFSSMAAKNDLLRPANARKTLDKVVTDFFKNGIALPNERYKPYMGNKTSAAVIARLVRGATPTPNAYKEAASYLLVDGAFNVNSTSVSAWKTMLAAAHRKNVVAMKKTGAPSADGARNFVISRFSMPNDAPYNATGAINSKWQGYHEVTDAQIGELAEAIVRQVKLRGPFRSLSEFINRRLGPEADERSKYGALQAALEDPAVSINAKYRTPVITASNITGNRYQNKTAALGPRYQGSPPYVTQADLLNSMGPVLTARSDTFLIRAYGQARDAKGNVQARAWCEAVVQRLPAFVDPKDAAETVIASLTSPANKVFGRRFNIIGFRWLAQNEI